MSESTQIKVPFVELVEILRPMTKIKKSDYLPKGDLPIVDQGEWLVGGFTADLNARFPVEEPVVVFGDHTCRFKYVDFPFAAGADGTQVFIAKDGYDTRYIYYACLTLGLEHYGYQRHYKHLKASALPVFDYVTQRRIASILSAYDKLIEINTRYIEVLEEIAQGVYKEWFVKFRFPGHEGVSLKETQFGLVPEGWEIKLVDEIVMRLRAGKTYKNGEVSSAGEVIVVDQSRAEYLGFHNDVPGHEASSKHPIIIFGDHTCKMQIMVVPFSIGPNTVPFVSADDSSVYYVYSLVQGSVETQEYKRHWTELKNKRVLKAPNSLTDMFGSTVEPMFRQMEILRRKNRSLRAQRDLLLPKLVSGEIDVSEVELPNTEEAAA